MEFRDYNEMFRRVREYLIGHPFPFRIEKLCEEVDSFKNKFRNSLVTDKDWPDLSIVASGLRMKEEYAASIKLYLIISELCQSSGDPAEVAREIAQCWVNIGVCIRHLGPGSYTYRRNRLPLFMESCTTALGNVIKKLKGLSPVEKAKALGHCYYSTACLYHDVGERKLCRRLLNMGMEYLQTHLSEEQLQCKRFCYEEMKKLKLETKPKPKKINFPFRMINLEAAEADARIIPDMKRLIKEIKPEIEKVENSLCKMMKRAPIPFSSAYILKTKDKKAQNVESNKKTTKKDDVDEVISNMLKISDRVETVKLMINTTEDYLKYAMDAVLSLKVRSENKSEEVLNDEFESFNFVESMTGKFNL